MLMGTGTSHGIPVIACDCAVCRSSDPKDKRNRCSAYVEQKNEEGVVHLVIDTGPEFRIQALRFGIKLLDAVLLTHAHADHLNGLDDLRVFSHTKSSESTQFCQIFPAKYGESPGTGLPVYANKVALCDIRARFGYIFRQTQIGGGKPKLELEDCAPYTGEHPIVIGGISAIPIPMMHGILETTGWLLRCQNSAGEIHSIAYLTDCNEIPDSSIRLVTQYGGMIDHVVIDGLREKKHSTHFSYIEAMGCAAKIGGKHTWLTHICHNMNHAGITEYCKLHTVDFPELENIVNAGGSVLPAYDGLELIAGE